MFLGLTTYLGIKSGKIKTDEFPWVPYCSIFQAPIPLIERVISKNHCDRVKPIFKVNNLKEMLELIKIGANPEELRDLGCQNGHWERTLYISNIIEPEKIASLP